MTKRENAKRRDCVRVRRSGFVAAAGASAFAPLALAHLGSFGHNDGYIIPYGNPWYDVSYYNAGQYGANAGGGSFNAIPADSGLWRVVGNVGGYFTNAATRAAVVAGAPPYPAPPSGLVGAYIVGAHGPGRTDNAALAVRNDTPLGTGALYYEYDMDIYDFGGVAPSSVTSGVVSTQFYYMSDPGAVVVPGQRARDKFIMSFIDSNHNIGLQWGYADDNEVYWRANPSSPWVYSGFHSDPSNWDGVRVDIDLSADTFSIDYYDASTNTWFSLAPTTPLGNPMLNLTTLGWSLADGTHYGAAGKNFFDDFSFVPAPSSVAVLGLACLAFRRRR
jgi:hypothetical protein